MNIDTFEPNKQRVDCTIHGNAEALMNGKCSICRSELYNKEQQLILQNKINVIKLNINIPKRYFNATFDTYIPNCDKSAKFKSMCIDYDYNSNFIILGKTGVGKTIMACAIIDNALYRDKSCQYIQFYKINDIKINNKPLFAKLLTCDLLVIDEYGTQQSDYKNSLFFEIINERYNNMVNTIIITNLSIYNFKESIDLPVYSRIKQNCILFECDWNDNRINNLNKKD